jgi:hypothetical protein
MRAVPRNALVWVAAGLAALSVGLAARTLPARLAGDSGLPPPAATEAPSVAEVSLEPILTWSPFGQPARPAGSAGEAGLGLTLHGVVLASDAEASSAIVSVPGEPARAYTVGQAIAQDAILAEVHGDHVMLTVAGRREVLSFPEDRAEPDPAAGQTGSGVAALRAQTTGGGDEAEDDAAAEDR